MLQSCTQAKVGWFPALGLGYSGCSKEKEEEAVGRGRRGGKAEGVNRLAFYFVEINMW